MARLDPKNIYPYVCEEEKGDKNSTTFFLKGLTVAEYRECEELLSEGSMFGEYGLRVVKYGLVGWDNFVYEDGEVIPFDFNNIGSIPYIFQIEISNEIVELSELNNELFEELELVAKWGDWISRSSHPEHWECEYCSEKKLSSIRNCDGTQTYECQKCKGRSNDEICKKCGIATKVAFRFRFSNKKEDYVKRCPVAILTSRAIKITNLVNFMENSKTLPFPGGALEQTNFFYMLRSMVLSEQNELLREEMDRSKKELERKSKGTGN